MPDTIVSAIRAELQRRVDDGESMYSIAQESGLDLAALSRFARGLRGLSVDSLETLADYLRLRITDEPT